MISLVVGNLLSFALLEWVLFAEGFLLNTFFLVIAV